jgi:hypothetical protein
MSKEKQEIGGNKLPNNFGSGFSRSKSTAPKIGNASGGNATGPALEHNKGKQLGK